MALKTLVKVSKISNLSDARYCAGMGVDLLGFTAVPGQDQYVTPTLYKEIRGWFSGPQVVAEVYGISDKEVFREIIGDYAPDLIELSIHERAFIQPGLGPYILAVTAEQWDKYESDLKPFKNQIAYLLMPAETDRTKLKKLSSSFKIIVHAERFEEIDFLLENSIISGISLQGGAEERPGFRSRQRAQRALRHRDRRQ